MEKLLLGLALLGGAVFLGNGKVGGSLFQMSGDFTASAATMHSFTGDSSALKADDPVRLRKAEMRGYVAKSPAMAASGDDVFLVMDVLSDVRRTNASDVPAQIFTMEQVENCQFLRPIPGDFIANIQITSAQSAPLPIRAFSEQDRVMAATRWIAKVANTKPGQEVADFDVNPPRMSVVDVIVTETSAPVYLVLQSERKGTLWNIHTAKDVFIAHIAIVSGGTAGIVNPDLNVPTEILDTTQHPECAVRPYRKPEPHWQFVRNVQEYRIGEDALEENLEDFKKYSTWYQSNFGLPADIGRIGYRQVNHILVGPRPTENTVKIPYQPVAGVPVYMSQNDFVFASGSLEDAQNYAKDLHMELILAAAGGELSSLTSQVVEAAK